MQSIAALTAGSESQFSAEMLFLVALLQAVTGEREH
jgi:hypothetical protein